jgi:hypothetical protein
MNRPSTSLLLGLVAVATLGGCASTRTTADPSTRSLAADAAGIDATCRAWFARLDATVDRAGTRDAEAHRIADFPFLRVDRFTASFGPEVRSSPANQDAWIERMRRLDRAARAVELDGLDATSLAALGIDDAAAALSRVDACASDAIRQLRDQPTALATLIERARVPDAYRDWLRVLGLYPLTRIPFAAGIRSWEAGVREAHGRQSPDRDPATVYRPRHPLGLAPERVRAVLERAPRDALGIPEPDEGDRALLFTAFAPILAIATQSDADRIGAPVRSTGDRLVLDIDRPTVYARLAHARYRGHILLQLVYTAWFPERPPTHALDILSGRLDGIILRVTLDPQGRPVLYDTIHPCGCYHQFHPLPGVTVLPAPDPLEEWAFVPAPVPAPLPGTRIRIRIAGGTHEVTGVLQDWTSGGAVPYDLVDAAALRAIPDAAGRRRSLYGPDGLVAGTTRAERWFFWPMGIPSAGTMRQWGHHATAFVGRRHFDDADLIERRFRFDPEADQ